MADATYSMEEVLELLGQFLLDEDGAGIALLLDEVREEWDRYNDDDRMMISKGFQFVQRVYNHKNNDGTGTGQI